VAVRWGRHLQGLPQSGPWAQRGSPHRGVLGVRAAYQKAAHIHHNLPTLRTSVPGRARVGAHAPPASAAHAAGMELTGAPPPTAAAEPFTFTHPSKSTSGAHNVQLLYCPALFLSPPLVASCNECCVHVQVDNECCVHVQGDKPGRWRKIEIMDLFYPQQTLLSAEDSVALSSMARSQDTLSS
jgi:hypothetical protein